MSYCLNPTCTKPENPNQAEFCQTCGTKLVLRDRYRISKVLGRGGFGTTFLSVDMGLPGQPTCVVKQLRPAVSAPQILQMARELFQREASTLGKVGNHPQLPRLLDYFELGQEFYLVQDYIAGATLQQEVRRSGVLNEAAVRSVLTEVLPILDYLHGQEVIHRDIKPANLIRRSIDNRLVLIDFGAVKDQVNAAMMSNPDEHSTFTSFAVGTPGYAPPEQLAMRPVYASDLYALGVTCVFLLTGKSPKDLNYDAKTGLFLWHNLVNISPRLREILDKMLELSLRDRYQSAQEVLRVLDLQPHLDQLAQGLSVQQTQPIQPSPVKAEPSPPSLPSPAARHAGAIRSQQARLEAAGISTRPRGGRTNETGDLSVAIKGPVTGAIKGQAGVASKTKLDAAKLIEAYRKGRRDFTNQDLRSLVLRKAHLAEAVFHQAQLNDIDLQGANLFNANLGRASLTKANLRDANLQKAYLSYADLAGADLRGANLSDAYLSNANLRGTNLCGAILSGATVTEEQLALAHTNWRTRR